MLRVLLRPSCAATCAPEGVCCSDDARVHRHLDRGDVGALLALTLENTLLTKRIEALDVIQQLWNTRYALETLLAIPPGQWPEQ